MSRIRLFAVCIACLALCSALPLFAADCLDGDGDSYAVCGGCDLPQGLTCGDCVDSDAAIHPGATEICDGIDNDCDTDVDLDDSEFNDPDPIDDVDNDDGGSGDVDEGFGNCVFHEDGPAGECKTGGRSVCVWPPGLVVSDVAGFGTLTCENENDNVIFYSEESLANSGSCSNGEDDDCDGFVDIHDAACQQPEAGNCDGIDNDQNGFVDEIFPLADPGNVGQTCMVGEGECERIGVYSCLPNGSDAACSAVPGAPENEGALFGNSCGNGDDDDCDMLTDLDDPDCAGYGDPELCGNGLDDDGDGFVDEGYPTLGLPCSVGVGECTEFGTFACTQDGMGTECDATAGEPDEESELAGTCFDSMDNDCDGVADAGDASCAAAYADLGVFCGLDDEDEDEDEDDDRYDWVVSDSWNDSDASDDSQSKMAQLWDDWVGSDDSDDSDVWSDWDDECGDGPKGWPRYCAKKRERVIQFGSDKGTVKAELLALDADGNLLAVLDEVQQGDIAKLASSTNECDWRWDTKLRNDGRRKHKMTAPLPILRVTATNNGVEDVAWCSIVPWLDVTDPDGLTLPTHESTEFRVNTVLPLVDVDTLQIRMDGVDILDDIMADLGTTAGEAFPTGPAALCTTAGSCTFQVPAGCGDESLVDLEIRNLRVEGLDRCAAPTIEEGISVPGQVNTLSFEVSGLSPGGHIFHIKGHPLPPRENWGEPPDWPDDEDEDNDDWCNDYCEQNDRCGDGNCYDNDDWQVVEEPGCPGPEEPDDEDEDTDDSDECDDSHDVWPDGNPEDPCLRDDLIDTGTISALGIRIDSPENQEVVGMAPVTVTGAICGGNEIASFMINGKPVDVLGQTCTEGDCVTDAPECYVNFSEEMQQTDLQQAASGNAPLGTFKRGSNRVIADASDDRGNRTFNTDVVFGLGPVQAPASAAAMQLELEAEEVIDDAIGDVMALLTTEIDPAFVVGLEEEAVQDFFNEKCSGAIDQFTARATASLNNKAFGTIDLEPGCSCNLYNVPIVLETLIFTPSNADPKCKVDFAQDQLSVVVNLPKIFIQVGVHDSCTDHGLFGECIARTKINVTAVTKIEDLSFGFTITETQIETKTAPDSESFTFAWTVLDNGNNELFLSSGTCTTGPKLGKECFGTAGCGECVGGEKDGKGCKDNAGCPGGACNAGTCTGVVKNPAFDPVTAQNSGIECWGADLCSAFQIIGAVLIEIFTFGIADGFEIVDFFDFDFEFQEEFFDEIAASEPDAMELDEIEVDEDTAAEAGNTLFTPGPIDVEIENGGLTVAFPANFASQSDASDDDETPGAPITPAATPTVAEVIAVSDEITMLVADDVFGQMYYSMKEAGQLTAFCTDLDGRTVNDLLPADCDSLGGSNVAGATIQGICHAIRGNDCPTLTGDTNLLTNTKVGVCVGFQDGDCTALPVAQKVLCNLTPSRNISGTDGLLLCAAERLEPDFLIREDNTLDSTVQTDLLLNDLDVAFALDRAADGYNGSMFDLPGCFSQAGDQAADCLMIGVCLDLTLTTSMGIDSSECPANNAGFVFTVDDVMGSGFAPGLVCNAATGGDDQLAVGEGFDSVVIDAIRDAAQGFTPLFCVEGLDLGGVLDFNSMDAKMFGLTTSGATGPGFADYLGITVSLGSPTP